jgi:hypothetical protein
MGPINPNFKGETHRVYLLCSSQKGSQIGPHFEGHFFWGRQTLIISTNGFVMGPNFLLFLEPILRNTKKEQTKKMNPMDGWWPNFQRMRE